MQIQALILLLAQTCVAEIDFQETADECVVMWQINARTAERRGVSLQFQTRRYNAYWRVPHTTKAWVGRLKADGSQPEGWPADRSWLRAQPNWTRYLTKAERFLQGELAVVSCGADSYGGTPGDGLHADDAAPCAQALRVHCVAGERQAYWDTARCRAARRSNRKGPLSAAVAAGISAAPAGRPVPHSSRGAGSQP